MVDAENWRDQKTQKKIRILFEGATTTGEKIPPAHAKRGQVPPAHAKRVLSFLRPSVHPSVRAKRGIE